LIDINLLNRKGVYSKSKKNKFTEIDENIDNLIDSSNAPKIIEDDFESRHKSDNGKSEISFFKKSLKFFVLILVAVGIFFYYQYFIPIKHEIDSSRIKNLIFYVLGNEDISLNQVKVENDNFVITFDMSSSSFKNYKTIIGNYFDDMNKSNQFEYILSNGILKIKSSKKVIFLNDNFDQSVSSQEFESADITDIDKVALQSVLDSIFNINNKKLINFNIIPSRDHSYYYYNISLSK